MTTTNTAPVQTTKHTERARSGKYRSRQCGCCGGKNTKVFAEGADKWCECADCGHSTELST